MTETNVSSLTERRVAAEQPQEDAVPAVVRPANIRFAPDVAEVIAAVGVVRDLQPSDVVKVALREYFIHRLADPDLPARIDATKAKIAAQADATLSALESKTPGALPVPQPRSKEKGMTESIWVRLESGQINRLTAFALVDDGGTLAEQVRAAVELYLASQFPDGYSEFMAEYRASHASLQQKTRTSDSSSGSRERHQAG